MSEEEIRLKDGIYEIICDIESDFGNISVKDIYQKLAKLVENDEKDRNKFELEDSIMEE